jgi:hypothetical protein
LRSLDDDDDVRHDDDFRHDGDDGDDGDDDDDDHDGSHDKPVFCEYFTVTVYCATATGKFASSHYTIRHMASDNPNSLQTGFSKPIDNLYTLNSLVAARHDALTYVRILQLNAAVCVSHHFKTLVVASSVYRCKGWEPRRPAPRGPHALR